MKFNLRSWLTGYALGLAGNPLPFAVVEEREPVAYLYNGVRLPPLPEWDKTVYPYAYIVRLDDETTPYMLRLLQAPLSQWTDADDYIEAVNDDNYATAKAVRCWYFVDNGAWGELSAALPIGTATTYAPNIIWCNTDIPSRTDTVYLSDSEPVPIYE